MRPPHLPDSGASAEVGALQADFHHPIPIGFTCFYKWLAGAQHGIVDEDVHSAEARYGLGHHAMETTVLTKTAPFAFFRDDVADRPATFNCIRRYVRSHYSGTVACNLAGDGAANA